jgi:O-antigen ligase
MTTLIRLFGSLHEADLGASVNDRVIGQELALARWAEAPFIGWGIGEFGRLYPDLEYPHNLLLELLMELGLVGFWLLLALLVIGLVRAWRLWPARPDWAPIALIILFVTLLLSRMTVQGFLPDERILFALLGMILGLGRRAAQKPS